MTAVLGGDGRLTFGNQDVHERRRVVLENSPGAARMAAVEFNAELGLRRLQPDFDFFAQHFDEHGGRALGFFVRQNQQAAFKNERRIRLVAATNLDGCVEDRQRSEFANVAAQLNQHGFVCRFQLGLKERNELDAGGNRVAGLDRLCHSALARQQGPVYLDAPETAFLCRDLRPRRQTAEERERYQ
jgi:hypothetical protein